MTALVDCYWCELVAHSPGTAQEWCLGEYRAPDAYEAMFWLVHQAERIANALSPLPDTCPFPAASLRRSSGARGAGCVFREWKEDADYRMVQLHELLGGRRISANVRGPDTVVGHGDVEVSYHLSARPIAVRVNVPCPPVPGRGGSGETLEGIHPKKRKWHGTR